MGNEKLRVLDETRRRIEKHLEELKKPDSPARKRLDEALERAEKDFCHLHDAVAKSDQSV